MMPHVSQLRTHTSGIDQVVMAYFKHLPDYGITLVEPDATSYDLIAGHIGWGYELGGPFVVHCHGLHWTADYACYRWQYKVNAEVIDACRRADAITVPSAWVAETFQRDMRLTPHIISHGIDWSSWQHSEKKGDYTLWNKNRNTDVCNPMLLVQLAQRFPRGKGHFVTTFLPQGVPNPDNMNVIGLIPHDQMKTLVQSALVYLSTTKETFGIGTLEAMASGVPVLGIAHGGNVALIEHGVSGYLAKADDIDDLAEGLAYCIRHRDILGANGRELARKWTWETACEKVAEVYRQVVKGTPPTVSIVIPVYNKSEEEIGRAVESAINQTFKRTHIIVVDDGSSNEDLARNVVASYRDTEYDVELFRQDNNGVAVARNKGINLAGNTRYVCCLDSDDWIGPRFIESCVAELEADSSLGIVYSALKFHKPDGGTGISSWPPRQWDFDGFLNRQNQVPTCCVFRRDMWERLGGYHQRYAPKGCGAEDAEFWLRSGAYGWRAKMVDHVRGVVEVHEKVSQAFQREATRDEVITRGVPEDYYDKAVDSLFHYSWLSGIVSSDPAYEEIDWLVMHPWVKDGKHPMASYAKPVKFSHPVRQYDEPDVSVIIPVGPGHEELVVNALVSLESQTYRKWEVIVVDDSGKEWKKGQPGRERLLKSYPYIRYTVGDGKLLPSGQYASAGAGAARNQGARMARAPFLVFLDADDSLYPEALEKMFAAWNDDKAVIYSDYVGKAIISQEHAIKMQEADRLLRFDEKTGVAVMSFKSAGFDCERAQEQPEPTGDPNMPFYQWSLITSLIPKAWHDEIGGFDEEMPSWEDIDYHWRLAKAGHCYHHITEPLVVYQFHTGNRRELGRQQYDNLVEYLYTKHEEIEIMGCCGGRNRSASNVARNPVMQTSVVELRDEDFITVRYDPPSKGRHQVTGGHVFPQRLPGIKRWRDKGSGVSIDYGQLQQGDVLPVHRLDVEAHRHYFLPVSDTVKKTAPKPEKKALPEPLPIVQLRPPRMATEPPPTGALVPREIKIADTMHDAGMAVVEGVGRGVVEQTPPPVPILSEELVVEEESFDLQTIPGVGPSLAKRLEADGIESKDDLLRLGAEGLATYKGIGVFRAGRIIEVLSKDE